MRKKSNSSASTQLAPQNPRRRLLETSRLASLTRSRVTVLVKDQYIEKSLCTGGEVGRRMETMAGPKIEGDGESCRKTPPRRRGKGIRRDSVIASQHLHQRRGDVLFLESQRRVRDAGSVLRL
jgi:hypothetical protein